MAYVIALPTKKDERGSLTVLEKCLPFAIARVYWLYDLNTQSRGKHRHKLTWQGMICLQGKCEVLVKNKQPDVFVLNKPDEVLILPPQDWHEMRAFKENTLLIVVASHEYDPNDYIREPV